MTHDVVVKVFNPENIGFLVDSFLKYPNLQLEGFEWRPLEVFSLKCRKWTNKRQRWLKVTRLESSSAGNSG